MIQTFAQAVDQIELLHVLPNKVLVVSAEVPGLSDQAPLIGKCS